MPRIFFWLHHWFWKVLGIELKNLNTFMKIKYIFPVLALMLSTACSEQGDEFPFRQGKLPNDIVQENGQNPPLGDKGDSFDKKYGIKSGTIYFESWFKFEDKFSEGTSVVYFDDYGLKE